MSRPRKYTPNTLKKAVNGYFDSISRLVPLTEKRNTGRKDSDGHVIYEEVPVLNRLGVQATVLEYLVPPTVGGLCEHLGIHRSTWADYCDAQLHPEFSDTTTHARGRMRAWLEEQLLTRKDVKGIVFDLQNNYGYPKLYVREVEDDYTGRIKQAYGFQTNRTTRPVILSELIRILRESMASINDRDTLLEMLTFVRREKDLQGEAESGAHDDCVLALAIAHYIRPQQTMEVTRPRGERVRWSQDLWDD